LKAGGVQKKMASKESGSRVEQLPLNPGTIKMIINGFSLGGREKYYICPFNVAAEANLMYRVLHIFRAFPAVMIGFLIFVVCQICTNRVNI
jgi:hypothetical protein